MAYREFTDQAGVLWRVWDTYPSSASNVRSVYAAGWLGFESDVGRRRLHPVPQGWDQAPDHQLWEWLRQAIPVNVRQTESFLQQAAAGQPEPPAAPVEEDEGAVRRTALMDATRSVVERARSVLNVVSATLAHTNKEEGKK
jgi:hypothetical protein